MYQNNGQCYRFSKRTLKKVLALKKKKKWVPLLEKFTFLNRVSREGLTEFYFNQRLGEDKGVKHV